MVLLLFTSSGCGACESIEDKIKEISDQVQIIIYHYDYRNKQDRQFFSLYGVTQYPTIMLYDEGKLIFETASTSLEEVRQKIESRLKSQVL